MLYTPEMVSRLQKLRSRLYAEFGIRIRLADPELLDILSALAPRAPSASRSVSRWAGGSTLATW